MSNLQLLSVAGAFSVALYREDDPNTSTHIFVLPFDENGANNCDLRWRQLEVLPMPLTCATRLTVGMVAAVAALHVGILGVPTDQARCCGLPTYRVHYERNMALCNQLTVEELDQPITDLSGRAVFIVPEGLEFGAVAATGCFQSFIVKTITLKIGYAGDPKNRPPAFRKGVLLEDASACWYSKDSIVDAAHIIHRYIGSPILYSVLDSVRQAWSASRRVPQHVLDSVQQIPPLFADLRYPPVQFRLEGRIDQTDNGEALSPTVHTARDQHSALANYNGTSLWFDIPTSSCHHAQMDFGELALDPGIAFLQQTNKTLFFNPHGKRDRDLHRLFMKNLDLYLIFCQRFMPAFLRQELISAVATATRQAKTTEGNGSNSGNSDPPTSTSTSNTSNSDVINKDLYEDVWASLSIADRPPDGPDDDDELAKSQLKTTIEGVFPHLVSADLPVEDLQEYHKRRVFDAVCLLHLGACIVGSQRGLGMSWGGDFAY
ncbi:hypothetical protein B0H15DRAFT_814501 [Mycena belliarum]|uniref:Uncharacterized protein n=1 Tax=Mycena belliarum TaxID=1033014 RepID=A0AAD6Y173_9AGAR|nr:hypothetical protein B0H15DRAFT_814501 [Mycena belliae]